jgi:hypothetical protein
MTLAVYRFRLRTAGVSLDQVNTEIGTVATLDDAAGGIITDIECDDSRGQDLIDSLATRGYEFVAGDPAFPALAQFRVDNTILEQKAGVILAAAFLGSPRIADVTFSSPFGDTQYAIALTPETSLTRAYITTAYNKTATGFTINLNSNKITGLVQVSWTATRYGGP